MTKLFKINTLEDGTERFQTQLELLYRNDSVSFIRGTDGIMKVWGNGERGFSFYEYHGEYEIVETLADMKTQKL